MAIFARPKIAGNDTSNEACWAWLHLVSGIGPDQYVKKNIQLTWSSVVWSAIMLSRLLLRLSEDHCPSRTTLYGYRLTIPRDRHLATAYSTRYGTVLVRRVRTQGDDPRRLLRVLKLLGLSYHEEW